MAFWLKIYPSLVTAPYFLSIGWPFWLDCSNILVKHMLSCASLCIVFSIRYAHSCVVYCIVRASSLLSHRVHSYIRCAHIRVHSYYLCSAVLRYVLSTRTAVLNTIVHDSLHSSALKCVLTINRYAHIVQDWPNLAWPKCIVTWMDLKVHHDVPMNGPKGPSCVWSKAPIGCKKYPAVAGYLIKMEQSSTKDWP